MFKVRVPATSANVGPGFDTLGMALSTYNTYTFRNIKEKLVLLGVEKEFDNEENLIYKSMLKTWEYLNIEPINVEIDVDTQISITRGLGSSAACVIAGIVGAAKMANITLSNHVILEIAMMLEGHPDNITPALLGGMTIATSIDGKIEFMELDIVDQYAFYAFIPPFSTSTKEARSLLPTSVTMEDAVFNVSRASMLIASLVSGKQQFLRMALEDNLHQKYRTKLIEGYDLLLGFLSDKGFLGTFVSGAGPTVIAIAEKDKIFDNLIFKDWNIQRMELDLEGAKLI